MVLCASWIYIGVRLANAPASTDSPSATDRSASRSVALVSQVLKDTMSLQGTISRPAIDVPVEGYLTRRITPGTRIASGGLIAEVNGRPYIAADLPFPLWRDLHIGDAGRDVEQVRAFLRRHGDPRLPVSGALDRGVADSVARLYTRLGYASAPNAVVSRNEWVHVVGDATIKSGHALGARVSPEQPLVLSLGEGAILTVNGSDLADLSQAVTNKQFRLATRALDATIVEVAAAKQGMKLVLKVTGDVPTGLVAGEVELRSTPSPVLVAPRTAIRTRPSGESYVTVVDAQTHRPSREQTVELGFRGTALVEVRGAGLSEGTLVEIE